MPDAGAQDLLQGAPGPEPGAPVARAEPAVSAGQALFNPFGAVGVVAPVQAAPLATLPEVGGWSAVMAALVAAVAVVRLLRWMVQ